jgi:hypothetical protein
MKTAFFTAIGVLPVFVIAFSLHSILFSMHRIAVEVSVAIVISVAVEVSVAVVISVHA